MTNHDQDDPVPSGTASERRWRFAGFAVPTTTPVPDQLFDELMPRLAPAELVVTLYIIRRTFGFKKTSDSISLRQLTDGIVTRDGRVLDGGTGLSKATVARALNSLEEKGVIIRVRNRSDHRGDEPTTYQLNFLFVVSQSETPPLSQSETPRVSPMGQAVSHQRDTQQTEKQQTDEVFSNTPEPPLPNPKGETPSKFRRGSRPFLIERERGFPSGNQLQQHGTPSGQAARAKLAFEVADHPTTSAQPQPAARLTGGGMTRISEVLAAAGIAVKRATLEPRSNPEPEGQERLALAAPSGEAPPERIDLVIEDISTKLRDTEHLASNITQARRLWQNSGQSVEDFVALLYEVRETVRWKANVQSRMPYFFKCVKVALGLEPNPHVVPQQPAPLTAVQPATELPAADTPAALLPDGTDTKRLWKRVLKRLEDQVTRPIFETYLRDTAGIGIADGRLVVETPSAFVAEGLASKYSLTVRQALVAEEGMSIAVDFVVTPAVAAGEENSPPEALRRPRKARQVSDGRTG